MSTTPIERAAAAFEENFARQISEEDVRTLLAFALNRDELIEVLNSPQHAPDSTHSQRDGSCSECPWPLHALPPDRIADAIRAHLLGGAS